MPGVPPISDAASQPADDGLADLSLTGPLDRAAAPSLLRRAMLVAAASRLYVFVVGFLAASLIHTPLAPWTQRFPRGAEVFHGVLGNLLGPWAHWDGVWYIKIAMNGYADADGSAAFFPLYPLLLRWFGVLFGGNLVIAGIVFSLGCYFGAMAVLYRLVEKEYGARAAYRCVLYISIFPTAFFFQAVYSESLFLLLSVSCFKLCQDGRWRRAGLVGLLATLTRSSGVLLFVPMVLMYYRSLDWKWRRTDARLAGLLIVPEGLLVWMAYLGVVFQRPFLFAQVQNNWQRSLATPNYSLWQGLQSTVQGFRQLVSYPTDRVFWPTAEGGSPYSLAVTNITDFSFTAVAIWLVYCTARRLPLAYWVYATLAVGFPLLFPSQFMPLLSMPRFVLTAFPLMMALGLMTRDRPRAHAATVALSLVLLTVLTAKFAVFSWVA